MPERTNLKLYQTEGLDIFYNPKIFEEKRDGIRKLVEGDGNPHDSVEKSFEALYFENLNKNAIITYLRGKHGFEELVSLNARRFGLENRVDAMLFAPGEEQNGKWVYNEGNRWRLVQKWIKAHDGEYSLLLICCSRPVEAVVHNHNSTVIVPGSSVGELDEGLKDLDARIYVPKFGCVAPEQTDEVLRTMRALVSRRG
jgi:hypothetical protein